VNHYELLPIGSYCEPSIHSQYELLFLPFKTSFVKSPRLSTERAEICSLGIQNMTLEQQGANPERSKGPTPLLWAVERGHETIVKMLLERDDTNPNAADVHGRTPLFIAASKGCERVVKMLLARKDVNPNTANKASEAPLFAAVHKGHEGVLKLLLERPDINPNTTNAYGQTPLVKAAWEGLDWAVKILQERADINSDLTDLAGETALSQAPDCGYYAIAKLLSKNRNFILQLDGNGPTTPSPPWRSGPDQGHPKRIRRF